MDFPAYVPAAVRTYIESFIRLLKGMPDPPCVKSSQQRPGLIESYFSGYEAGYASAWRESLAGAECGEDFGPLDTLIALVESVQRVAHDPASCEYREEIARWIIEEYPDLVECLRRLALAPAMRDAFARLAQEFSDDGQWYGFIHAAWLARKDYAYYRERLRCAAGLRGRIAEAANRLARLLRQIDETCAPCPAEFFSVLKLLQQTDNPDKWDEWREARCILLGTPPPRSAPGDPYTDVDVLLDYDVIPSREGFDIKKLTAESEIDSAEEERKNLRYAWEKALFLPELLDTLAKAGRQFIPRDSPHISRAISSRKRNKKTEYLRALAVLLTQRGFILTPLIMRAMAVTASVVLDDPGIGVSYEDVRKALEDSSDE